MAYHLEGRLLEVCNCRVLCPCWIGEDPDRGTCDTIVAYHFDKGTIEGVDVTGRTIAIVAHLPGNILKGNWTVAVQRRRRRLAGAVRRDHQGLYRSGRRAGRRHRQAHRQGRLGRARAHQLRRAGRQGHDQGRQRRLCRARALYQRERRYHDALRHGVLDRARRARVRRQVAALLVEEPGAWHRPRYQGPQRPAKHLLCSTADAGTWSGAARFCRSSARSSRWRG